MAEKYGTIPKKFTKEWFEYVWMYYKYHILGAGFVIMCIVVTAYQVSTRVEYDTEVIYGGYTYIPDEKSELINEELTKLAEDLNGDGQSIANMQKMILSGEPGQEQMDYAIQTKLDLQFQVGESFLMIYDGRERDFMFKRGDEDYIYLPVSEWAPDVPADKLFSYNGVAYGVSLKDSTVFKNAGLESDDFYLFMRLNNAKDSEENKKIYESTKEFARKMIN